ncbi:MAG: hypothetical protein EA415_06740 [Sphaerobacteraceae bacterium]|nr:MAG: hypothetical protein EA415_06740 [Sphaerobacteraceae bacterium]
MQTTTIVEDLSRASRNMLDGAIAVTTGRLHLESPSEALDQILENELSALEYFRHELAHQVGILLVRMDCSVTAVYKEHELPEAEELGTPALELTDPIYLVVRAERETAALRALVEAIDSSLVDALSAHCGRIAPGLIHVDIIDQAQARRVVERAGGFRPPPTILVSRT